jgi:hypothetical protein
VGSKLKSREELRAEWQDFQERLERKKQEALTNHKGYYLCKMDAEQWLRNPRHLRAPDFKIVVVQNSIDVPVSDNDIFHLQVGGCGWVQVCGWGRPGAVKARHVWQSCSA